MAAETRVTLPGGEDVEGRMQCRPVDGACRQGMEPLQGSADRDELAVGDGRAYDVGEYGTEYEREGALRVVDGPPVRRQR